MKGLFVTSSSAALTGTTYQKVSLMPIGAIIYAVEGGGAATSTCGCIPSDPFRPQPYVR